MKPLDYDIWFDKYGSDYGDIIISWVESRPCDISLTQIGIRDLDDFVQEMILEAYESYISDFEDMAYEQFRDERL